MHLFDNIGRYHNTLSFFCFEARKCMFKSYRFLFRYIYITNSCILIFSIGDFLNCHSFYLFLCRVFNKLSHKKGGIWFRTLPKSLKINHISCLMFLSSLLPCMEHPEMSQYHPKSREMNRNHPKPHFLLQNHPKLATTFWNSTNTSQKNIPKNYLCSMSLFGPIYPQYSKMLQFQWKMLPYLNDANFNCAIGIWKFSLSVTCKTQFGP